METISKKCDEITEAINAAEVYSYKYNIKILGVPQIEEKESAESTVDLCMELFSAMGVNDVSLQDIDIAHRVSSRRPSSHPNAIVCKFVRRLAKEKIMAARKQLSNVKPDQLGIEMAFPSSFRVRVFDHLAPCTQTLLTEAKKIQASHGFKFCWARNNQICLRRTENSRIIRLKTLQELTNLIEKEAAPR